MFINKLVIYLFIWRSVLCMASYNWVVDMEYWFCSFFASSWNSNCFCGLDALKNYTYICVCVYVQVERKIITLSFLDVFSICSQIFLGLFLNFEKKENILVFIIFSESLVTGSLKQTNYKLKEKRNTFDLPVSHRAENNLKIY